ncbi:MAG: hypothetical protein WBA11_18155, partial [Rubrivirga sp.]
MSYLTIALFVFLAFATGGATIFFFLRDRAQAASGRGGPVSEPLAGEVRAIGTQIENALAEQRLQGETQRMVLSQKLDGVRQTVDTQQAQVQVLQSEMRHESQRRDAEIAEIHDRLASIQTGGELAPPPSLALEAHSPEHVEDEPTVAEYEPFEHEHETSPALEADSSVHEARETPVTPEAHAQVMAEPPQPVAAPVESLFSEVTFEDASFEDVSLDIPAPSSALKDTPVAEAPVPAEAPAPAEVPAPAAPEPAPSSVETTADESSLADAADEPSPVVHDPTVQDTAFDAPASQPAPFHPSPQGDGSASDLL